MAHQAAEQDDANIICLGERITAAELAIEIAAHIPAGDPSATRNATIVALARSTPSRPSRTSRPRRSSARARASGWTNIARNMLTSGELRRLAWNDRVPRAPRPTRRSSKRRCARALSSRGQARALVEQGKNAEEIYWAIAIEDIQGAADVIRATYEAAPTGATGPPAWHARRRWPTIRQATIDMAADLWKRLDRPNVMTQDSSHAARYSGDRGVDRFRHQRQHHAAVRGGPV